LDAISSTGTSPLVLEMPALLNRITSFLCTLDKKFAHRCEIQADRVESRINRIPLQPAPR
jgi:hypothetical protein